jgi:ribosomal protein L40E
MMSETVQKGLDEKYCSECGAIIKAKAEICPKCGVEASVGSGMQDCNLSGEAG